MEAKASSSGTVNSSNAGTKITGTGIGIGTGNTPRTASTSILRKRINVLERAHSLSSLSDLPLRSVKLKHTSSGEGREKKDGDKGEEVVLSPSDYEMEGDGNESSEDQDQDEEEEEEKGEKGQGERVQGAEDEEVEYIRTRTKSPSPFKPRPASSERLKPKPTRPVVDTSATSAKESKYRRDYSSSSSPMSPTTRAWYEFDLAVVVALVSPVGNWLTGGDHIKNLLLIVLLIFYLHQIIEVPWQLYQKCRPRHRPYHTSASLLSDPTSPESRYASIASSELQKLESLFLLLTFLSPLLGALLLRYATAAVLGPHAVSWFSTGLFVLATGMRPWSHLVKRISERTDDLHDFVHYPSPGRDAREEDHRELKRRVGELEGRVGKLSGRVRGAREDVERYVDEAMEVVESVVRKQERRCGECRRRVEEVEKVLSGLLASAGNVNTTKKGLNQTTHKKKKATTTTTKRNVGSFPVRAIRDSVLGDMLGVPGFARSVMGYVIPTWLVSSITGTTGSSTPNSGYKPMAMAMSRSNSSSNSSKRTHYDALNQSTGQNSKLNGDFNASTVTSPSTSQCATPLETIHEEGISGIQGSNHNKNIRGANSIKGQGGALPVGGSGSTSTSTSSKALGGEGGSLFDNLNSDQHDKLDWTQTWYWAMVFERPLGVVSWCLWVLGWVVGVPFRAVGRMVGGSY